MSLIRSILTRTKEDAVRVATSPIESARVAKYTAEGVLSGDIPPRSP